MKRTLGTAGWLVLAAATLLAAGARPALAQSSFQFSFQAQAGVPPSLPQPVTNLSVSLSSPTVIEGELILNWTAPDAYTPVEGETVQAYTIKYATFSISPTGVPGATDLGGSSVTWWNTATFTSIKGSAQPPGFNDTLTLTRLEPGVTYFFAIRSTNSVTPALSPFDSLSVTAQQAYAVVPNFIPPTQAFTTLTPLCGREQLSWTPINTNVTYDFDRYRVLESSPTSPTPGAPYGNFFDVTGGAINPVTQLSTGTLSTGIATNKVLANFTTYYYEILAYDRQGLVSVATAAPALVSTMAYPVPPNATSMSVQGSSVTPSLFVTWANPSFYQPFQAGILVRAQGTPLNTLPVDFSTYTAGANFGNGSVVAAWNAAANQSTYADTNLAGGTTYQYYVFNEYQQGSAVCWSNGTSGSIVLQPRPMAPSGVSFGLDQFGFSQVSWAPVSHFDTGAPMHVSGAYPPDNELFGYNVYSSTCSAAGCAGNSWTLVNVGGVIAKTSSTFTVGGAPTVKTYYVVRAVNNFSFESANSNTVDSALNLYAVATVGNIAVAQAIVPASLKAQLLAANNITGVDLTLVLIDHPEEEVPGGALRSIEIQVHRGDTGATVGGFTFKNGTVQLTITANSTQGLLAPAGVRRAQGGDVDIFWFNGVRFLEMNGDASTVQDAATVVTSNPGKYQLRSVTRTLAFTFDPSQDLLPRVITPNGDGLNDIMFFNTKVDGVTGKIFDIRGAKVADLLTCPGPGGDPFNHKCLYWDGKVTGKAVHSGIYIYDLNGQGHHFTGTAVVAN